MSAKHRNQEVELYMAMCPTASGSALLVSNWYNVDVR